ncbi:MAG: hypothetical protein QGD94_07355 [Planctomycetia bacterium]|nr:hypothetical protein [Planctomycetia bacterium]
MGISRVAKTTVAVALVMFVFGTTALAKKDHEYVKPIDWKKIKLVDDELTRWIEKNAIMWKLKNTYKPLVDDTEKFEKMTGTQCAFFICDVAFITVAFDWDEKEVGVTKKQLLDLIEKSVHRIHAAYQKDAGTLHGGTADGVGMTWAVVLAWGTWPVWEHLSEDAKRKTVEVLLKEAKRFEKPLKTWSYPNSNIEESSTEATFYSIIANMMPDHPLNKHWEYCTRHWTYSHVVSLAELQADPIFSDGTRLREYVEYKPMWVWFGRLFRYGGSIHDDGSVMNHETVNFHYAMTSSCRFGSLLWYNLAGRKPPEGLTTIGVKRTRNWFVRSIAPWGGHISPDGYESTPLYGALFQPNYYLLYWHPTPEAWAAWQMTFDLAKEIVDSGSAKPGYNPFGEYYQMKLFGPLKKPAKVMSPKQLMKRLSGVHVAPTSKYVLHRSPDAYSIYSFHNFSANGGLLTRDPVALCTGGDGGLLVRSKREADKSPVEDSLGSRSWATAKVHGPVVTGDGFSIIVRRDSKQGITNHTAFVSLPGCNTVLVSRTMAREDMDVDKLHMGRKTFLLKQNTAGLGKAGLKKWPWWGDHKVYMPEGMKLKFGRSGYNPDLSPRPAWVNVGNRMGYVPIGTSPMIGAGGQAIVFETYKESRKIKAGGEIGRVILVTFPGVTAAETARLADEVHMLRAVPDNVYGIRIPKVKALPGPVWVIVNFRDEDVNITLPFEAGGDGKVTVGKNSCLVVPRQTK